MENRVEYVYVCVCEAGLLWYGVKQLICSGTFTAVVPILPGRLTFHLLAQVGAPAVPHILHGQQVLLCVVNQQQRNARHHQLVHHAEARRHVRLLS